jgi:hypothetical protein
VAASLVAFLLGAAVYAQTSTDPTSSDMSQPAATASMLTIDGKVVTTSASSLVIETDAGKRLTFNIDSATAQPASLAAGDRVTVRYSAVSGTNHAENVALAAAAPITTAETAPPPAPPADTSAPATTATTSTRTTALPKTASPLPLVLLVGTLAALVAFGVHLSRERV